MNNKDNNQTKLFTRQQKEIERKHKATEDNNIINKLRVQIKTKEQVPIPKEKQIINNNPELKDLAIKRNNIFCILVEQLIILHRAEAHYKNLLLHETQNLRAGAIYIPH